jgi:hypothetical protein
VRLRLRREKCCFASLAFRLRREMCCFASLAEGEQRCNPVSRSPCACVDEGLHLRSPLAMHTKVQGARVKRPTVSLTESNTRDSVLRRRRSRVDSVVFVRKFLTQKPNTFFGLLHVKLPSSWNGLS